MTDDAARRERMPLPPVTPGAIRATPADPGTAGAPSGQAPLLPPFMAGRTTPRWKVPFPPQWPHATPPAPNAGPDTLGPIAAPAPESTADPDAERVTEGDAVEPPPDAEPPTPVVEPLPPAAAVPPAASALPAFDDRMPWEIDDTAAASADVFVPGPFDTSAAATPEPTQDTQDVAEPWEPWDPSQLWDDQPSQSREQPEPWESRDDEGPVQARDEQQQGASPASPAVPSASFGPLSFEEPLSEAPVGDDPWQQDVTERVAARLEELAREVRARGIAGLGAAENADELSRLIAGVIAGFLTRDEHG